MRSEGGTLTGFEVTILGCVAFQSRRRDPTQEDFLRYVPLHVFGVAQPGDWILWDEPESISGGCVGCP